MVITFFGEHESQSYKNFWSTLVFQTLREEVKRILPHEFATLSLLLESVDLERTLVNICVCFQVSFFGDIDQPAGIFAPTG